MFSGAGIYADGVIFAIVFDDTLYLKADEILRPRLSPPKARAPSPIAARAAPVAMPYWEVPERLLDDPKSS